VALALALALLLAPPDTPPSKVETEPASNVSVAIEPIPIEAAPLPRKFSAPEPEIESEPKPEPEPTSTIDLDPPPSGQPDLRFRLEVDLPLTLGFTGVWAVTEGFKPRIAPQECHWCTPSRVGVATRNALVWRNPDTAALTSDVVAYAAIPALTLTLTLVAVGREGEWKKVHEDLLVALEAVAVSAALTNAIKFTTARTRPYAEYEPIAFGEDPDQNLSFPSGHSSFAFAFASSFATVATLRRRKLAPVFWALGMPTAAFVGYLRMAGDRHWLGDVLVGAGLGTLVGVGLPWLLHHPRTGVLARRARQEPRPNQQRKSALRIVPTPGGVTVVGRL
jgi:membrane-associated phospholipid phosphatase